MASCLVTALEKSSWCDEATNLHEYFELALSFYSLSESECEMLWDTKKFKTTGFRTEGINIIREKMGSILASGTLNNSKIKVSKIFMRKRNNGCVKYGFRLLIKKL